MPVLSSIFWVLGFIFSVLIAPQLRIWTWGPSMICFALATVFALPRIWKESRNAGDLTVVIVGAALVTWIAARAALSPVAELAQSDFLLLAMAVATFVSFRAITSNIPAQRVLVWGIAVLTLASVAVTVYQAFDPKYSPVFSSNPSSWPSGFYAHYSYGASFMIIVSLILGGIALHSKEHVATRIFLGSLALAALASIYLTNSRGAFAGAAGGVGTLVLISILKGKRNSKNWFAPAVIVLPFLIAGIGYVLYQGWNHAQNARSVSSGITGMLDNSVRLYLLNIAISCIQLHPLIGGGARSFSWECFRFWDIESMGQGLNKPEHVHNELVQTATDYGVIGASLLLIFLACVIIVAVIRISSAEEKSRYGGFDTAWRIGGIAAFIGIFIQSNVEGIFRIPPGAVLLALCLSASSLPSNRIETITNRPWFRCAVLTLSGIISLLALGFWGSKGSRVTTILWSSYFGNNIDGNETKIHALSNALQIWPLQSLFQQRGNLYQKAAREETSEETSRTYIEFALADAQKASSLNPFNPFTVVSSANLLSLLKRDAEAEAQYERAIVLQGGMEAGFQAHFMCAKHFHRKGLAEFDKKDPTASLSTFQIAVRHIDKAFATSWVHNQNRRDLELLVLIHENYGLVLELLDENKEAMAQYDAVCRMSYGESSHYRAAALYGKLAVQAWSERRSSDALRLFMNARHRIGFATILPDGITTEKRDEFKNYIEKNIQYLKGAQITPSEKVDF